MSVVCAAVSHGNLSSGVECFIELISRFVKRIDEAPAAGELQLADGAMTSSFAFKINWFQCSDVGVQS